ncbi:MAG: hypothetical protein JWQ90_324 [Hydrocarboniphaga sp.]|nr:hypothetical protein [Hydrocarboniphaga sp.]
MREQLPDVAIERSRQPGEHIEQPSVWLMTVGFGRREQTHDRGGAPPRRF